MKPDKNLWKWVYLMNKCNKGSFRIRRLKSLDGLTGEKAKVTGRASCQWGVARYRHNSQSFRCLALSPQEVWRMSKWLRGAMRLLACVKLVLKWRKHTKMHLMPNFLFYSYTGPWVPNDPRIPIQGVFVQYERKVPQGCSTSSRRIICSDTKLQCKVN